MHTHTFGTTHTGPTEATCTECGCHWEDRTQITSCEQQREIDAWCTEMSQQSAEADPIADAPEAQYEGEYVARAERQLDALCDAQFEACSTVCPNCEQLINHVPEARRWKFAQEWCAGCMGSGDFVSKEEQDEAVMDSMSDAAWSATMSPERYLVIEALNSDHCHEASAALRVSYCGICEAELEDDGFDCVNGCAAKAQARLQRTVTPLEAQLTWEVEQLRTKLEQKQGAEQWHIETLRQRNADLVAQVTKLERLVAAQKAIIETQAKPRGCDDCKRLSLPCSFNGSSCEVLS